MIDTDLAREIERANRKIVELRRAARSEPVSPWSESALAELSSALEELRVAQEELQLQNVELAEANAAAEFEKHRFRELFMSAPLGQVVTDLRGVILEANRTAGDVLGAPAGNLADKPLALMITLDDRDRFHRWVRSLSDASHDATVCADCGGSGEFQVQTVSRSRSFPCEITAAPLADRLGRIDSIRWCLRDISEREQAGIAQRLTEESRRKDEFLAVLAHELRNPLAAISLASEILTGAESAASGNRQTWAAGVVQRHADQLRRLVDDLLDVSRVSYGKVTLQTEVVDLREVIHSAVEGCQTLIEGRGHEVVLSLPAEPVFFTADGQRLRQVLGNLIDNAAKYTPEGGRIEIGLARDGAETVVSVEDSGVGIPPDMLEQIFAAFEQVESASELRERGLGLGLALVRQLVELHGGTVRATSGGEGKGSRFVVQLPADGARDSGANGRAAAAASDSPVAPAPLRVLIVDDNADAAELLAASLRKHGYAVELAVDGKAGVAAARRSPCHVALVDLGLPDLDGFEVCRELKRCQPTMCLVALTGFSDSRSREQATEAGFDHFLVKPLDPHAVTAAISELAGPAD